MNMSQEMMTLIRQQDAVRSVTLVLAWVAVTSGLEQIQ